MAKTRAIRPTRRQKEIIKLHNLLPESWLVIEERENVLFLVSKKSNRTRKVEIRR